MTLEELLYTHLTGDATLTALVGNRIYPVDAPQNGTLPDVRYQLITRQELVAIPGRLLLVSRTYQFDGFAESYSEAKAVEVALKAALYRFNKQVHACILSTFIENVRDTDDPEVTGFGTSLDALITCSE